MIRKGAEANLYLTRLLGRDVVVKERVKKSYRVDSLDQKTRTYRTIHEAQMIHEAKEVGVSTPIVYLVDEKRCRIFMEYIQGPRLKEALATMSPKERESTCRIVGGLIGRLHASRLMHGDLTTSNMILTDEESVSFIDFGLSYQSSQLEDKGVDLHLMRRALNSTHFAYAEPCFKSVFEGYRCETGLKPARDVLIRTKEIERRGRYFAERQA